MTSWNEYKEKIKNEDEYGYELITEIEKASDIVADKSERTCSKMPCTTVNHWKN